MTEQERSDAGNMVVTRLDGALGKKQVCRPMFPPDFFRKQIYFIEESTCDVTLLGLSASPAVIQCPHSDSAPGELCPPRYAPV